LRHFIEPPVNARFKKATVDEILQRGRQFGPRRVTSFAPEPRFMGALDQLFGGQRNQDAQNDDSNFAGKLAPPVQRLWQVEVHATGPPAVAR
jgi:hypothetical protein